MARGFKIPIVHVNADDPEACVEAARLAGAYRARFRRDFLIDLVGYRRYGHNEGDEPSFTQPVMYRAIANHPTVREIWARTLEERGDDAARGRRRDRQALHEARSSRRSTRLSASRTIGDGISGAAARAARAAGAHRRAARAAPRAERRAPGRVPRASPSTASSNASASGGARCSTTPSARTIDWAAAEDLAYASLLEDGVPIRLTGEDVERGTFSHRHAVLHDAETGRRHIPLQRLPQARASFEIHNSPLSENATVGFEFGYNVQAPARLVLWEAQYGDFINGAQVIIDEFLTSARAKWGLMPSLVLLLPHGYEGQGPEHSSARRRAVSRSGRRHQPAGGQLHDGGAVLSSAAASGEPCCSPIRCRSSC